MRLSESERKKNLIPITLWHWFTYMFCSIHLEKIPLHRKIFPGFFIRAFAIHTVTDPKQRNIVHKKKMCMHTFNDTQILFSRKTEECKKWNKQKKNHENDQRNEKKKHYYTLHTLDRISHTHTRMLWGWDTNNATVQLDNCQTKRNLNRCYEQNWTKKD